MCVYFFCKISCKMPTICLLYGYIIHIFLYCAHKRTYTHTYSYKHTYVYTAIGITKYLTAKFDLLLDCQLSFELQTYLHIYLQIYVRIYVRELTPSVVDRKNLFEILIKSQVCISQRKRKGIKIQCLNGDNDSIKQHTYTHTCT